MSVKPLSTEITENKTTPKLCKITAQPIKTPEILNLAAWKTINFSFFLFFDSLQRSLRKPWQTWKKQAPLLYLAPKSSPRRQSGTRLKNTQQRKALLDSKRRLLRHKQLPNRRLSNEDKMWSPTRLAKQVGVIERHVQHPGSEKCGLCEYVMFHTKLPPSPVILWIELGGEPKWLPLILRYYDVMCTSPRLLLRSQRCCKSRGAKHWLQTCVPK